MKKTVDEHGMFKAGDTVILHNETKGTLIGFYRTKPTGHPCLCEEHNVPLWDVELIDDGTPYTFARVCEIVIKKV